MTGLYFFSRPPPAPCTPASSVLHVRVLFSPGAAVVQVGVFSADFTHTWKTGVPQKTVWCRYPVQVGVFSVDFAHTWTSPLGSPAEKGTPPEPSTARRPEGKCSTRNCQKVGGAC